MLYPIFFPYEKLVRINSIQGRQYKQDDKDM